MGGSNFKLDTKAIEKVANKAIRELARKAQPHFDQLHRDHAGQTVEEIEPVIQALFRQLPWSPKPGEVQRYAEITAQGQRIELKPPKE